MFEPARAAKTVLDGAASAVPTEGRGASFRGQKPVFPELLCKTVVEGGKLRDSGGNSVVQQKGSVLVYALILMALLLSAGLALATLSRAGAQTARRLAESIPAYYAAESCLEQALRQYVKVVSVDDVTGAPTSSIDVGRFSNPTISFDFEADGNDDARCTWQASKVPPIGETTAITIATKGLFRSATEGLSVSICRKQPRDCGF